MILAFRPIDKWPPNWERGSLGKSSPFRGNYQSTLEILERELAHLKAKDVHLQIDIEPGNLRLDGQPRAGARANYRGCIFVIDSEVHGVLSYACDAFESTYTQRNGNYVKDEPWQSNLRAIALGLESLRQIERYGIANRGQQYAGFAQIGSGIPMGPPTMTVEEAARLLAKYSGIHLYSGDGFGWALLIEQPGHIERAYQAAAKMSHPDVGGDAELFGKVTEARDILLRARARRD